MIVDHSSPGGDGPYIEVILSSELVDSPDSLPAAYAAQEVAQSSGVELLMEFGPFSADLSDRVSDGAALRSLAQSEQGRVATYVCYLMDSIGLFSFGSW